MADNEKIILENGRSVSPPPSFAGQERKTSVDVEKVIAHSHDADEAMKAFAHGEIIEVDEATNKRLLRIIDWHLMPIMCVIYGINYLDKTTISYASIMGLKTDLNLKGDDYQWLGSMFYFGYLAWEYPTNRLLQRLPLAKYSAFNVVMWGTTLACFAGVSNFGGAVGESSQKHVSFSPYLEPRQRVSPSQVSQANDKQQCDSFLVYLNQLSPLVLPSSLHSGTPRRSKVREQVFGSASMDSVRS